MCIVVACQPVFDAINFEINLIFLNKPFYSMIKKSRQNFNILRTKRAFQMSFSVCEINEYMSFLSFLLMQVAFFALETVFKGAISGLRQFLATESLLK